MELQKLSPGYSESALLLKKKLRQLREQLKNSQTGAQSAALRHEIAFYSGIMTQCRDLARLTSHYYERSYYRDEKYTL